MSFKRFPQEPNNGDPPSVPVLRARASGQPGGDVGGGGDTPDPVGTAEARTPINGPICQRETSALKEHELGVNR